MNKLYKIAAVCAIAETIQKRAASAEDEQVFDGEEAKPSQTAPAPKADGKSDPLAVFKILKGPADMATGGLASNIGNTVAHTGKTLTQSEAPKSGRTAEQNATIRAAVDFFVNKSSKGISEGYARLTKKDNTLKDAGIGAGIGAVALGTGSAAYDVAHDKDINKRRALILAAVGAGLGAGAGAASGESIRSRLA